MMDLNPIYQIGIGKHKKVKVYNVNRMGKDAFLYIYIMNMVHNFLNS